jgi:hypothetical protein
MKVKFRNRAILLIGLAILMFATLAGVVALRKHGIPDGLIAVCAVCLGIGGAILYLQGCIALAEARGHNGPAVASIVILIYACGAGGAYLSPVLGAGFLTLLLIVPLIVLIGTTDKFKRR